jgi:opacity protein-like surface antigen
MTNKTTKICCTLALLASVAATPAFSQAKNFTGPSIAVGGGYSSQTFSLNMNDAGTDPVSTLNFDNGKNDFAALIDLGYGVQVDKNFILSIGGTYDLTDSEMTPMKIFDGNDNVTTTVKTKLKDHYALYIQPTYLVNDGTGIFAKLSYNFVKSNGTVSVDDASLSSSKNLEGWGYGIGAKTFLNNNTYLQIEGSYVEYDKHTATLDDETTIGIKPKVLSALISVGYKF